jgi:hypothetical protein
MAITGWNFNGTNHLTVNASGPRFATRIKFRANGSSYAVGSDKACDFILQGICESDAEADRMITQATNGHRRIHMIKRTVRGKVWIGIYCG